MPRFRGSRKPATQLTDAIQRILTRAKSSPHPFAVFVNGGALVLSNMNSLHFKTFHQRYPDALIAIYGPGLTVTAVLDDLREHFPDEVAHDHA
ncbi:hypothetical protein [Noviherbaspirillum humi]|nr:hypothetical protein [Noviherbaspirillum humi]